VAVEFRLLGAVEAYQDGEPIAIGYAQLQCVLAILLVEANCPVPADRLIERAWAMRRLPRQPRGALQHCMTLLRRALAGVEGATISRRPAGYQITVAPEDVDLHRFQRLLDQAHAITGDEETAELFKRALALYCAEPFAGLDVPCLNALRTALDAQRWAAQLDLMDIELRRGRHAELLPKLTVLAERDPLDERLAGQYMLALYRNGRQAAAMAHYHQLRRRLAEQLGADPRLALQGLYLQILGADPKLDATVTTRSASRIVPYVVPRQLPAAPQLFTGRADELGRLDRTLDEQTDADRTVVISISGIGGIGKTWLAVHWAHRRIDRFPDGQLHVNLRGFDPVDEPLSPDTAVRGFLDTLGVDPGSTPAGLDARVGLYRSLVADRRILIMLDNAHDASQVIPLLPGGTRCTVLVTSRDRLVGLTVSHGARLVSLDMLSEWEGRALLGARIGSKRLTSEPDAVAEVLAYCGGLPLALGVVAARAIAHPFLPLAGLAAEMRDAAGRLDALDEGDPAASVPEVLSWSYRSLSAEQSSVLMLLGLAPGPDIGLPAAASLTGLSVERVRGVLRKLENVSLVRQHLPGRYRMPDPIRLQAAWRALRDLPEETTNAALRRLVDFYLHTTFAAACLMTATRPPIELDPPAAGATPHRLTDAKAASSWLERERPSLLRCRRWLADRGWRSAARQLTWMLVFRDPGLVASNSGRRAA